MTQPQRAAPPVGGSVACGRDRALLRSRSANRPRRVPPVADPSSVQRLRLFRVALPVAKIGRSETPSPAAPTAGLLALVIACAAVPAMAQSRAGDAGAAEVISTGR